MSVVRRWPDAMLVLPFEGVALSSTVDGGVRFGVSRVVFHRVGDGFDVGVELSRALGFFGVGADSAIVFMTAVAPADALVLRRVSDGEVEVVAAATVGLKWGYRITRRGVEYGGAGAGTVNVAVAVVGAELRMPALVDVLRVASEAKSACLAGLAGVHGTVSDALGVVARVGGGEAFAGPSTRVGRLVAEGVCAAVEEGYSRWVETL